MRALAVLILAGCMLPAYAAKKVTVAELEQSLFAARSLPDAEAAKRVADLELTERLSPAELARLDAGLPGESSRRELMILADASAILKPPPAEIPNRPVPDAVAQRKILALTVNYVSQTLHQLPNFFATRVTSSFEDSPAATRPGAATSAYQPIHSVADSRGTVTFRDGREVVEKSISDPRVRNLSTSGIFGPVLGTVIVDAARSRLTWSHWEQGPTGPMAVFAYEVPQEKSHYTLTYDSVPEFEHGQNPCTSKAETFHEVVAYHGEISSDPASGTILRLVLSADMKPDEFTVHSDIAVEYGQIDIGGKDYFLPVRSITSSLEHSLATTGGWGGGQGCPTLVVTPSLKRSLNNVVFENYHVFRSDAKVLTEREARNVEQEAPQANAGNPAVPAESANPIASDSPPPVTQPSPSETRTPEPTVAAVPPPSAQPASASPADFDTPVLRTTTRQVLVDVIVDKKSGEPVPSLQKSDFSISEDGKPQTIDFFEEHSAAASAPAAKPIMPSLPSGAVTNVPGAVPSAALYVFLLDSLNSEPQDQAYTRLQILSFLHKLAPGTQVAVFSLGSRLHLLHGFTSDPAALLAAVTGKQTERDAMAQNRSDRADDANRIATLQSMRSTGAGFLQAAQANAGAYSFGARASMTFEALSALARYLEGIPGRKNLVWFSGSFPVLFFPTPAQLSQLKSNPALPGYINRAQQTANLFTLSKIAIYPVSGAGVQSSTVGLADSAGSGRPGGSNGTAPLAAESMSLASNLAGMEQLAASTGGRAFATNDIDTALRKIVHDSDVYYTLGYAPPAAAAEGVFRRIDVKVAGGKYKLDYRQGYNAAEPGVTQDENPIASLLQAGLPSATGILYGLNIQRRPESDVQASHDPSAGQNPNLSGPLAHVSISFTIRAQDIEFGQAPNEERVAKLLVGVKAYGKDGAALNWQAGREAFRLDHAQYQAALQTGIPVSVALDLPASASGEIVTAVCDFNTSRCGSLETQLEP